MNISNFLAIIWGITFTAASLSLLAKPKRIRKIFEESGSEANMFTWGVMSLIVGLATILIHNVWTLDWRVFITILGWLTLLKGLDVMFLPEKMRKRWDKMTIHQWTPILFALLFIGLIFTYLGFTS